MPRRFSPGFSLVEMLVVLAMIGLLIGLAVPAATGILKGTTLTQAADKISQAITKASESAAIENRPVGIRFYRYEDDIIPNAGNNFRAFQLKQTLVQTAENIASRKEEEEVTEVVRLPDGVIIIDDKTYSTIVTDRDLKCPGTTRIPSRSGSAGSKTSADCYGFDFLPNGTTSLPKSRSGNRDRDLWYITLAEETDLVRAGNNGLPSNFITLQVDPFTGSLRRYQP